MLPGWLAAGIAIAGLLAVGFAALFVAGERLFPTSVEDGEDGSGEWKRRGEIRAYLDAIGERYAEEHAVAGETVAFYLPERDVAVTFDARAYFALRTTGTHAILAEHEMPGGALGARLPFEVPAVDGFDRPGGGVADEERDRPEEAFRLLGVEPTASAEEVRAAYRQQAKETHPDHGGDEEAFRRLQEAYTAAASHAGGEA